MYAVGDIQGINNRLGPQWLQNTTSPPWGNQPITALRCLWLTVSQSGPFVHLTERPQTLLSLALSLSLSVRPHCQSDAGLTSWSQDQTEKETGKSLWSVKLGTHANPRAYTQANTLTHSKTHRQSSPLFFDTCRLHWGGGAEEKGFNQQFYWVLLSAFKWMRSFSPSTFLTSIHTSPSSQSLMSLEREKSHQLKCFCKSILVIRPSLSILYQIS